MMSMVTAISHLVEFASLLCYIFLLVMLPKQRILWLHGTQIFHCWKYSGISNSNGEQWMNCHIDQLIFRLGWDDYQQQMNFRRFHHYTYRIIVFFIYWRSVTLFDNVNHLLASSFSKYLRYIKTSIVNWKTSQNTKRKSSMIA